MSTYKIAVFVGSLRAASINLRLARALEKLVPPFQVRLRESGRAALQPGQREQPAPGVAKLKQQITESQGVLFVSPEHNRSVPAAIKNAIDWGSRPWGHNSWAGKAAGVLGTSPSAAGTALMQQHLRNILAAEGSAR